MKNRTFCPIALLVVVIANAEAPSAAEDDRQLVVTVGEPRILSTDLDYIKDFAFSRDGAAMSVVVLKDTGVIRQALGLGGRHEVRMYDLRDEAPTIKSQAPMGTVHPVAAFTWTDAQEMLLFPRWNLTERDELEIVDLLTGEVLQPLQNARQPPWIAVAFSGDATQVANWARDRHGIPRDLREFVSELTVSDLRTGKKRLVSRRSGGQYWTVVFSPDGSRIAAGGVSEFGRAEVAMLDIPSGETLWRERGYNGTNPKYVGNVLSLAFAPNGQTLVSGGLYLDFCK